MRVNELLQYDIAKDKNATAYRFLREVINGTKRLCDAQIPFNHLQKNLSHWYEKAADKIAIAAWHNDLAPEVAAVFGASTAAELHELGNEKFAVIMTDTIPETRQKNQQWIDEIIEKETQRLCERYQGLSRIDVTNLLKRARQDGIAFATNVLWPQDTRSRQERTVTTDAAYGELQHIVSNLTGRYPDAMKQIQDKRPMIQSTRRVIKDSK